MNDKGGYCPHCHLWVPPRQTNCTNVGCGLPLGNMELNCRISPAPPLAPKETPLYARAKQ